MLILTPGTHTWYVVGDGTDGRIKEPQGNGPYAGTIEETRLDPKPGVEGHTGWAPRLIGHPQRGLGDGVVSTGIKGDCGTVDLGVYPKGSSGVDQCSKERGEFTLPAPVPYQYSTRVRYDAFPRMSAKNGRLEY